MAGFGVGGRCTVEMRLRLRVRTGVVVALLSSLLLLVVATVAQATPEEHPKNITPPSIGAPSLQQFSKLNAKKGEWSGGGLTYQYQWQRCEPACANIAAATASSYEIKYADIGTKLQVIVTAKNKVDSAEATSAETETITPATPKNTTPPVIEGVYREDQLLNVTTGTWSGTPANSYGYQWERCNTEGKSCKAIESATESSYRTASGDVEHKLRATVTAIVTVGGSKIEKSASSAPSPLIEHGPPVALDEPSISGELRIGGELHAATGKWDGEMPIAYAYTWERCNAEGSCSTVGEVSSYTVVSADTHSSLRVTVAASNTAGSATTRSVATPAILGSGELEDFAVSWGEDFRGQGGTLYRTSWEADPVPVEGVTGIAAIAMGGSGSYELHSDGTITASGAGWSGTIGYGGRKASWEQGLSHVTVKGITNATEVSAGNASAAALLADGRVVDWGSNGYGILGNGVGGFEGETGENQLEPKEVKSLKEVGVTSVVAGWGDRFALLPGGKVDAWGYNRWGQLGIEWTPESCLKISTCETEYGTNKTRPRRLKPGEPLHKCYRETGWELCYKTPAPVQYEGGPLEGVTQIAGGAESTFALLENGEVLSWGNDVRGELGQEREPGPHTSFSPPHTVMVGPHEALKNVVALSAGHSFALALVRGEGGSLRLYGWGDDENDQLGAPAETCGEAGKKTWPCDRWARPLTTPEGVQIAQAAAGSTYSALVGTDGHVYTVGSNALGELGRGQECELGGGHMGLYEPCYSDVWKAVPSLEHVESVAAGAVTAMALVAPGSSQPLPVVGSTPSHQQLKLGWALPDGESAESLVYRKWEHPGEMEGESEGEGGSEQPEEEPEEGTGESPKIEVAPKITAFEPTGEAEEPWTKAKNEVQVGDKLMSSTGKWKASPEPYAYEYRWLRCTTKCKEIPETGGAGETANTYVLTEEDVGDTIEVEVTARNGVKPAGKAASEATETIKAEEEGRKQRPVTVHVEGLDGATLAGLVEPEYEVKLNSDGGPHGRIRQMVLRPGP